MLCDKLNYPQVFIFISHQIIFENESDGINY